MFRTLICQFGKALVKLKIVQSRLDCCLSNLPDFHMGEGEVVVWDYSVIFSSIQVYMNKMCINSELLKLIRKIQ